MTTVTPLHRPWYSCNTDAARAFNMGDNGLYGLGTLELRLADVDLDLRLSSEVKIATSEKDELDSLSHTHGLIAKPFHGDAHWKPWVVKSHTYQLILDLDVAPELTHDDDAFAQHIAAQLKKLKAGNNTYQFLEYTDILLGLGKPRPTCDVDRDTPEQSSGGIVDNIIGLQPTNGLCRESETSQAGTGAPLPRHQTTTWSSCNQRGGFPREDTLEEFARCKRPQACLMQTRSCRLRRRRHHGP